jgi:sec-independent protein translocase protein TatA
VFEGLLQPGHLLIILAIALIPFGPGKLAEVSGQLGRGIREFRHTMEGREPTTLAFSERRPRFCAYCGGSVDVESHFCGRCGGALT